MVGKYLVVVLMLTMNISADPVDERCKLPDFSYNKSLLYSGYLDIPSSNKGKRLHYLFVESQGNKNTDPLVLWLNGGPGCSSLLGFSDENGPMYFKPDSTEFVENHSSWNTVANMLYLEAPAGVGFSIASTIRDRSTNDDLTASNNLEALISFFEKFPEYENRDFYISGESYAGIYIPTLANKIIDHNASSSKKINLIGILVGNGVTDWKYDCDAAFVDLAYSHGLYSSELREKFISKCGPKPYKLSTVECKVLYEDITKQIGQFNFYDIYQFCDDSPKTSDNNYLEFMQNKLRSNPQTSGFSFLEDQSVNAYNGCNDGGKTGAYYNRKDVKEALHVNKNIIWQGCSTTIDYTDDKVKGSFYVYPKLIQNKIKILIYSGDTDGAVPTPGTVDWINNLKLKVLKDTRIWNIDPDRAAGIVTYYEGLTFVTVHGTGHMVPQWKRREALHMFKTFIQGNDI